MAQEIIEQREANGSSREGWKHHQCHITPSKRTSALCNRRILKILQKAASPEWWGKMVKEHVEVLMGEEKIWILCVQSKRQNLQGG